LLEVSYYFKNGKKVKRSKLKKISEPISAQKQIQLKLEEIENAKKKFEET